MVAKPELMPAVAAAHGNAFWWRFIVTGLGFLVFGVGALLMSMLIMPVLLMLAPPRCHRLSRVTLRRGMRGFVGFLHRGGALTYDFRGAERLGRPGQLIVANHPSLIDVVFLIAFTRQANCVVKHAMFRNPLTRAVVRATGYISNELTADMIEETAGALRAGECAIMFPEGTRSRPGQPLVFHRGAASIAVRAARVVTPVFISCEPATLTKSEPWYRIPPRRPHFTFRVGEDFKLDAFQSGASLPLAARACNERLCERFHDELQGADGYTRRGD